LVSLFLFTSKSIFAKEDIALEVLKKLEYQIEIKDYLGAKELSEAVYKKAKYRDSREVAYLIYWEANGFLHFAKGEFHKILEDIGGLNLYWSVFPNRRRFEYLYYEILGKLYTLLFQYRRGVIFFLEAYKRHPTDAELLNIIYATEMLYYNELRPYYNYSVIKELIKKVNEKKLNIFEKALLDFEKGFYYLLIKDYKKAYSYFKESYNLDKAFLTEVQANFFMGKVFEGLGNLKKAYLYYKLALKQVKHPIFKQNILYRLFIVAAKLKFYQEANNYYYGLTKFGGLETNVYLQEATLQIPFLDNFLEYFYWKSSYETLVAKIMWLNLNKDRGKRAFIYFLNNFINHGKVNKDFLTAWKVLYPDEVKEFKVDAKSLAEKSFNILKILTKLQRSNPSLFDYFFGEYGKLALAKYYFLIGYWDKAKKLIETLKIKHYLKYYIEGVIEAYKGKPYVLENYYSLFPEALKIKALFWLGWGYLISNRWDLTELYWENFLSKPVEDLTLQKIAAAFYLAEHYYKLGLEDKARRYYVLALKYLSKEKDLEGLKKFAILRLYQIGDFADALRFAKVVEDKNWQKLLKYLYGKGG